MTGSGIDEIARLFEQMVTTAPDTPGTLRRRLRADLRHVGIHLEMEFPERVRVLAIRAADAIGDQELLNTAGLRCHTYSGTVRVEAGPAVESEVFYTLVADLVHQVEVVGPRPTAALMSRIQAWQRMLAAGLRTGLSPNAQIGLFGELLVLCEIILPAWSEHSVQSWVGPTGASQDFRLGLVAIEVKCTSYRDPEGCRISNEDQLDAEGLQSLTLVHQSVRPSANEGTTLPELIDFIRAEPAFASTRTLLEERLLHAGWLDVHRNQYDRERFSLTARHCYRVVPGFPCVTRRNLPSGVRSISYSVELDHCAPYLIPEQSLVRYLSSTAVYGEHDGQQC